MLPMRACHSRYFRAEPIGEAITRVELVERLRLLWQGLPLDARNEAAWAMEQLLDAFGLMAEREEVFGTPNSSVRSSQEKSL